MQYQTNVKIVIDKRKLDTLIRLGVSDGNLLSLIKTQRFEPTGDSLIDEYLSTLVDVRDFSKWGGSRKNSGKKPKNNQLEKQDDFHLEKQDDFHLEKQDDFHLEKQDEKAKKKGRFIKPSVEEVAAYCRERGNAVDPDEFFDFYESKGWRIGKEQMRDWKAAVRTWEKRNGGNVVKKPSVMDQVAEVWDF